MHKVTSEILVQSNISENLENGNVISKFFFKCPSYMIKAINKNEAVKYDDEDDLDIDRDKKGILLIEHKLSTELQLVGLQVWRGALLLADYILSNPDLFRGRIILELGSGVGLTSIVASFVAKKVICTDISAGGILKLIERNFERNKRYVQSTLHIAELNFLNLEWPESLENTLDGTSVILAADVIYDADVTDGFVETLEKLLNVKEERTIYVALEKRYVFTVANLETAAPMYEDFLQCIRKFQWNIEFLKIDFPRYFNYDRTKEMTLMKIERKNDSTRLH